MDSTIVAKIALETEMDFQELRHDPNPLPLDFTWEDLHHDGSAGLTQHKFAVYIETADDNLILIPEVVGHSYKTNYAYGHRREEPAKMNISQAVAHFELKPKAVYVAHYGISEWSGQEDIKECSLTRYPWVKPDFKKIRRRVEDCLRKSSNNAMLMQVAGILKVKLD